MDYPQAKVGMAVMSGEVEQAIQVALSDVFTQPVTMHLGWRNSFAQAQFAEFVEDPRIQAAMQNWENEESALRERVKTYLADLSSTSMASR